jgi:hypothetical protein
MHTHRVKAFVRLVEFKSTTEVSNHTLDCSLLYTWSSNKKKKILKGKEAGLGHAKKKKKKRKKDG